MLGTQSPGNLGPWEHNALELGKIGPWEHRALCHGPIIYHVNLGNIKPWEHRAMGTKGPRKIWLGCKNLLVIIIL